MTDLSLFSPASGRAFGEAVARILGIPLAPLEERDFEDGEHKSRPLAGVRGKNAYVVQSLYGDDAESVNDKLVKLLFLLGALTDASAASVTAVVPYLCYARKEQQTQPRDPILTRYLARLFEAVGTARVVTLDVHNLAAFQNAFRCRTDHLEACPLFVRHFAATLGATPLVVVSPDAGGVKRAERLRVRLSAARGGEEVPLAFLEKHRGSGVLRGGAVVGEVAGRTAIVIDDLISTGSTLARAAQACRERGAVAVHGAVTHGVFATDAAANLAHPALDSLVVTDSLPPERLAPGPARDKTTVLSVAPLVARAIAAIHGGGSLRGRLRKRNLKYAKALAAAVAA